MGEARSARRERNAREKEREKVRSVPVLTRWRPGSWRSTKESSASSPSSAGWTTLATGGRPLLRPPPPPPGSSASSTCSRTAARSSWEGRSTRLSTPLLFLSLDKSDQDEIYFVISLALSNK